MRIRIPNSTKNPYVHNLSATFPFTHNCTIYWAVCRHDQGEDANLSSPLPEPKSLLQHHTQE
jgi:hypothetical protein